MRTSSLRPLLLAALLGCSTFVAAAPADTITYQGKLGTASGTPIDGTRTITFNLYFAVDGATAYWTETQSVTIDDGRFAVELGKTTPLPNQLFGEKLFLGIQIAGDVEMTPRLPLTATPVAFRARSLMRGTIHVPADGTPLQNGAALRAAIASAASPTPTNRYVVSVDAGDFDLGTMTLVVPSHVSLTGAGAQATLLSGQVTGATVELSSNSGIAAIGVLNTGDGGTFALPTSAVQVVPAATNVSIDASVLTSMPAGTTQGTDVRAAVSFARASDFSIDDTVMHAERSNYVYGLRSSVPTGAPTETGIVVRDSRIELHSGSFVRGVDISGRFEVEVDGLAIDISAGSVIPGDTLGFRVQVETALEARGLEIDMDYAGSAPNVLRGINTNASASVDIADFRIGVVTGGCDAAGFRNAIVARNVSPASVPLAQGQPQFRNGLIEVDATGCFAGGVYSSGSAPVMDNLRIHVVSRGVANRGAAGYTQRSANDACDGNYTMAGTANLRNSKLTANAESGFAPAADSCIGDLAIEHTTLTGDGTGFRAGDNNTVTHTFRIADSQLKGTTHSALLTEGESTGRVFNTVFETPFTPVVSFADAQTALRSKVACVASSTPTAFTAGPVCPCTAGAECPAIP